MNARARASVSVLRAIVIALLLAGGLASCPKPPLSKDPQFSIVLLDEREGQANALNNQGEVVGFVLTSSGRERATLWRPNGSPKVVDIGLLAGTTGASEGLAINDFSQVVGYSHYSADYWHAFLWTQADGMKDLGTLGGLRSTARDISAKGVVVGRTDTTTDVQAFVWDPDEKMRLVLYSEPGSLASAISVTGTIVGSTGSAYAKQVWPPPEARRWTTQGSLAIPSGLGGTGSMAHGVNVYGVVVGKAQTPDNNWHPFRWSADGKMTNLGSLGGCALLGSATLCGVAEAINTAGDIVGMAVDAGGQTRAVLWRNGVAYDLNGRFSPQSDWILLAWALDINLQGHIVGLGFRSGPDGPRKAAFLLIPKGT